MTNEATAKKLTRDEIRAKVMGAKPKSKIIPDFFGCEIEVRQPTMGVILGKKDDSSEVQTLSMLIEYTYIPGTNEHIFTSADAEALMELPFGQDMQDYVNTINELMGVTPKVLKEALDDAVKNA